MPSSEKNPSQVPMWKVVKSAYLLIAMCLFPLVIRGYWAYGNMIPKQGGMLIALYMFHKHETSELVLGLTSILLILSVVSSLQLYGKPIFDGLESIYTSRMKQPCPWWFQAISRVIFGFFCFLSSITISFYGSQLQVLSGGFSLPLTLALPCFMWIKIKKTEAYGPMWWFNWTLGLFGMALVGILIVAGVYVVIVTSIEVRFFKPH